MSDFRLYDIPAELEKILAAGEVDEETGEWIFDQKAYDELEADMNWKLENLLLHGKNTLAWADGIKAEADRLKAEVDTLMTRYKQKVKEAERCFNYAEFCLAGKTFETQKVKVTYSKVVSTEVKKDFIEWALDNGRDDLLSYAKPTANKTAVKKALQSGEEIPYAKLVTGKMKVQ